MTTQPGFTNPITPVEALAAAEAVDQLDGRDDNGVLDNDEPRVAPDEPREDEPTIVRSPDLDRELS